MMRHFYKGSYFVLLSRKLSILPCLNIYIMPEYVFLAQL